MTTINSDIYNALSAAVASAVGSMPVEWENSTYDPDIGTPWCSYNVLPQPTVPASIGLQGLNLHSGTVLLVFNYPRGSGADAAIQKLDAVSSIIKRGVTLTSGSAEVRIESVWRPPVVYDKAWVKFPLQIRWRCHAGN